MRATVGNGVQVRDKRRCQGCASPVRIPRKVEVLSPRTMLRQEVNLCPSCVRRLSRGQPLTSVFFFRTSEKGQPMYRAWTPEMMRDFLGSVSRETRQNHLAMARVEAHRSTLTSEEKVEHYSELRTEDPELFAKWQAGLQNLGVSRTMAHLPPKTEKSVTAEGRTASSKAKSKPERSAFVLPDWAKAK